MFRCSVLLVFGVRCSVRQGQCEHVFGEQLFVFHVEHWGGGGG